MIIDAPRLDNRWERNIEARKWKPIYVIFPRLLQDGRIALFENVEYRKWCGQVQYRARESV